MKGIEMKAILNKKIAAFRRKTFFALLAVIASAGLIAETGLVPDPATIPTPSASSVFYFVPPTPRQGLSSVSAGMTGLVSVRQVRTFRCAFGTRLTSCPPGLLLILQ